MFPINTSNWRTHIIKYSIFSLEWSTRSICLYIFLCIFCLSGAKIRILQYNYVNIMVIAALAMQGVKVLIQYKDAILPV